MYFSLATTTTTTTVVHKMRQKKEKPTRKKKFKNLRSTKNAFECECKVLIDGSPLSPTDCPSFRIRAAARKIRWQLIKGERAIGGVGGEVEEDQQRHDTIRRKFLLLESTVE